MRRTASLVAALLGAGLLVSACGGHPSSPGVANAGKTSPTTVASAPSGTGAETFGHKQALAFSRCVRAHGMSDFPDPTAKGSFTTGNGVINGQSVDTGSHQFATAVRACQHLLPNGGQPTPGQQQQALSQALQYVHCMRAHGVPNMSDPKVSPGGGVGIGLAPGVDPNSPQFQKAQQACRSLQVGASG